MNSPNLLASAAAQRTKKLKLLIYGNLLPLHNPLRLAEEIAMLDCLSDGRMICGVARGIPREYQVFNVNQADSRARFNEAFEIMVKAWTEEAFSYEGKFWTFRDIACWPRPVQQPYPPFWTPITASRDSIEWAGRNNVPITPGIGSRGLQEDIIGLYAGCLAQAGHRITPGHISISVNAYVADSKAQAVRENGPYQLYFNRTLYSHGNVTETNIQRTTGYVQEGALDYIRPENRQAAARARADFRNMTMADIEKQAETQPWGTADEVAERIIEAADAVGAGTVQLNLNRGAMPQEMFLEQIRRVGDKVLPRLQAHKVTRVPPAEMVAA
jgi:alkanesulfonate monooxygenase SsuD/methylene tetrahydromethanopterin reductase-like flavin-dependent oxidoreductase (luciferase family)